MKVICVKNDLQINDITVGNMYEANEHEIDSIPHYTIVDDSNNFLCIYKNHPNVVFLTPMKIRDQKIEKILK